MALEDGPGRRQGGHEAHHLGEGALRAGGDGAQHKPAHQLVAIRPAHDAVDDLRDGPVTSDADDDVEDGEVEGAVRSHEVVRVPCSLRQSHRVVQLCAREDLLHPLPVRFALPVPRDWVDDDVNARSPGEEGRGLCHPPNRISTLLCRSTSRVMGGAKLEELVAAVEALTVGGAGEGRGEDMEVQAVSFLGGEVTGNDVDRCDALLPEERFPQRVLADERLHVVPLERE
mmetsp:Transcript_20853/g.69619  ORF Transcript_20853/g.69619 Transcript_20853/m.69619 type:complete len:229 (-) Transcript_20853:589-1275(-)